MAARADAIISDGRQAIARPMAATEYDWCAPTASVSSVALDASQTSASVQRYLDELAALPADSPSEGIVRALLARSVDRLHLLCARLLHKSYPRLTAGPVNLHSDEVLSAVVERLIKAMRQVRPATVRQFFALANQHMRWELNGIARRLDHQVAAAELRESRIVSPPPSDALSSGASPDAPQSPTAGRILAALDALPEEEREVFDLVRLQGMTHPEAAAVIGCSTKTIQRRLNRGLVLLSAQLRDLVPADALAASVGEH